MLVKFLKSPTISRCSKEFKIKKGNFVPCLRLLQEQKILLLFCDDTAVLFLLADIAFVMQE